jgi:hypothetical protein
MIFCQLNPRLKGFRYANSIFSNIPYYRLMNYLIYYCLPINNTKQNILLYHSHDLVKTAFL